MSTHLLTRSTVPRLLSSAAALLVAACGGSSDRSAEDSARLAALADTAAPPPVVSAMPAQLPGLPARPEARARRIDVWRDTSTFGTGPAVVTLVTGDTVVVADSAVRAWVLGDGSLVAVSGLDGAGGFENEGQSLTVIDVAAGTRRRVVADYFQVVRVELLRADGAAALLVHMRDGGQGSLHVTVVDPDRGPVFRARNALGRITGDRILVAGFGDGEIPVEFGDRRTPLRVDTLTTAAVDTLSLLVVPRAPR
ncbi:MAG: hypothetical protein V4813_01265 [Gemmatimonadota bacterium]